ncbi:MAG: hypothetical protein LUF87_11505 [Alistipes sp.]|nr:hypothetical protein [Alistipes sp.]
MKKFYYLLPAIALVLAACSDDDDKNDGREGFKLTLSASEIANAPSAGEIDAVKLVTEKNAVLQTATWNDGFTIEFNEAVGTSHLMKVTDVFYLDYFEEDEREKIKVSDESANVCPAYIFGYEGNTEKGEFYYTKELGGVQYYVQYIFADRAVNITGTASDRDDWTCEYTVRLEYGWNRVMYYADNAAEKEVYTSTIATGFHWVYEYNP